LKKNPRGFRQSFELVEPDMDDLPTGQALHDLGVVPPGRER
jgi:hypothetical protein